MTQNLSPSSLLVFSRWIRQQRRRFGFTQTELARRVNCSVSTIRKLENGVRHPSTQLALLLAEALHIPAQERERFLRLALDEPSPISTNNALPNHQFILPHPPTELIGRATDIENVQRMFDHTNIRLVTILGAPGVGKTRLALEVAANLARDSNHSFADGVCYVSLAPIRAPNLVAQTLISALGAPLLAHQTPTECLVVFLKAKSLLLVLDNFEHLLPATALIAELLVSAPNLKILVTSRTALRLTCEHEYGLQPLALPTLKPLPTFTQLAETPAVALYIKSVQALNPQFALNAANAAAIAELCVRLDGLPLAIELAAARSRLLPPATLLQRLTAGSEVPYTQNEWNESVGKRLSLLTEGARDLAERHQTIRDALAWSYHLLTPPLQTLFARLAVFAGDYTIDAAEAICDATLDQLEALITHSLLHTEMQVNEDGKQLEVRFVMLETIREYAWECLSNSGELNEIQRRHAEYYMQLARQLDWARHPTNNTRFLILKRVEREYANIYAALVWSQSSNNDAVLALHIAGLLFFFWYAKGLHQEARHWLRNALTKGIQLGSEPTEDPSFPLLREARAKLLSRLALVSDTPDEQKMLQELLTRCLSIERQFDDKIILWRLLFGLFALQTQAANPSETEALEKELFATAQATGNHRCLGWTLYLISKLARRQGQLEKAHTTGVEGIHYLRLTQDTLNLTLSLQNLAYVLHSQGEYQQAQALWLESLKLAQQRDNLSATAYALNGLACLAGAQSQYERAVFLFGATDALYKIYAIPIDLVDRIGYEELLTQARANLDNEAFEVAWQTGNTMPLTQVVAQAFAIGNEPPT
ncbi:MAG: helix-turn-helix domain-containing protein [Caldilineaceae bacterium]